MRCHYRDHRDQPRPNRDLVGGATTATTATTPYRGERVGVALESHPNHRDRDHRHQPSEEPTP